MTNNTLYALYKGLLTVRSDSTTRFPARTSFALLRNLKTLQPIVEDYEESRLKLFQTYGKPADDNPNQFVFEKDAVPQVTNELQSLDDTEVEVSLVKIKLSDLDSVELSVEAMEQLFPLIEES